MASEQTLSQLLRLISKPALGSLQFNASLRIVILSLPCSATSVLPPLLQSQPPFPPVKNSSHLNDCIFIIAQLRNMPSPLSFTSILLLNKNWAAGALFTHYLFKSPRYRALGVSGCLGTVRQCPQNQHLNVISAFEHLQNSVLLRLFSHLMLHWMVRKMKK